MLLMFYFSCSLQGKSQSPFGNFARTSTRPNLNLKKFFVSIRAVITDGRTLCIASGRRLHSCNLTPVHLKIKEFKLTIA